MRALTRRQIVAGVVTGATALALAAVAPTASATPTPHAVPNSLPHWTASARVTGTTASTSKVNFGILLGLRNQAGAAATLQSISDPTSAHYGKWLTNAQFKAQYAPAAADVSAVSNWLSGQGFQVDKTLTSGLYVEASGSAAQVDKVFATTLKNYSYQGKTVRANATALSFPASTPAAVTGAVAGIIGVDQGQALHKPASTLPGPPPGARFGVQPCSAYYGQKIAVDKPSAYGKKQPYAPCGYDPKQYESAYGESALLRAGIDGRGVTVAITDGFAAPTMLADLQTYSKKHGLPAVKPGQYKEILPASFNVTDPADAQGWYGEETLDVEAVHSMAPGAKIVYVGGADDFTGLDDAWAETIDNHVADIITNSWTDGTDDLDSLGQDYVDFYNEFALEAALTGITVNFSAGDDGDNTAGGTDLASKTVEFPADNPYVTGVGGTSIGIDRNGNRQFEYGWQTDYSQLTNGAWSPAVPGTYSSGGGGGTSVLYAQPFYQRGKVPTSMSEYFGKTPARTVPDISMAGDPNTGFTVGETQEFPDGTYYDEYRIGGTSLSSPLLAGVIAVADQFAHRKLGFVNPLYYQLLKTPALYDVVAPKKPVAQVRTEYTNTVDASGGIDYKLGTIDVQSTTIHSVKGYDTETGVGTPDGPLFFLGMALVRG